MMCKSLYHTTIALNALLSSQVINKQNNSTVANFFQHLMPNLSDFTAKRLREMPQILLKPSSVLCSRDAPIV